ncbi:hypothetical protein GQ457_10G007730 [Hibiscus cannabinus]
MIVIGSRLLAFSGAEFCGTSGLESHGCGGVLRNCNGDVRAMFAGPVELLGAEFAELMAIRLALSIFIEANSVGKSFLIVESDSQVVINWITNRSSRSWRWWKIFKDLDSNSRIVSKVKILYVLRKHNKLADNLAKTGARRSDLFKFWW